MESWWNFTQFKKLTANRSWQFAFWATVFALLLTTIVFSLSRQPTLRNLELTLLDRKLRFRSEHFQWASTTPSEDIVILGIDGLTDTYIRTHPNSGLDMTLPRAELARSLDYLTAEGARTVILDLEFRDAKPGDQQLAASIQRHGHVYAAARMDYKLDRFVDDQLNAMAVERTENPQQFTAQILLAGFFRPILLQQVAQRTFLAFPAISPLDIGVGPFFDVSPTLTPLISAWATQLNKKIPYIGKDSGLDASEKTENQIRYNNLTQRAYAPLCLQNNYEHDYSNNPAFLQELTKKQVAVRLQEAVPPNMALAMTYCHIFPIVTPFLQNLEGIGIPSVDYDEDAYIRSIQALYRGYDNHFYTYLGFAPALAQRQLRYTPKTLYVGKQPISLLDNQRILINWRNPRYLLERTFQKYHIHPETHDDLKNALNLTTAETPNALLGGGHIYRQVSMLDVLRRSHAQPTKIPGDKQPLALPLTPDEQARTFNVPYYPASGLFSFKNKIVIIGNTVTDIHRTPISNTLPGPEVVASVLDMMLHDRQFIHQPAPWLPWSIVGILALLIIGTTIAFENLFIGFSVSCLLIGLSWLINISLFIYASLWLELILPTFILGITLIGSTLYRYYIHDQEKHHLTHVFSKYVSPQIMHEIMKNPGQALDNLRGGKKILTVLFVDLQDFTQQFENADPEIMVSQLNEYFDVMTEVLLSYGGTYDKYMGDSIMAFFGAPAELEHHAQMACRAALALQRELETLNKRWTTEGKFLLSHGIGISSGEMFVGNFGSRNIKNFTVMGSNVNLGSRLETYTRIAHWPIIISENTFLHIQDVATVRDLGKITIKGFSNLIQIYGLEAISEKLDSNIRL